MVAIEMEPEKGGGEVRQEKEVRGDTELLRNELEGETGAPRQRKSPSGSSEKIEDGQKMIH